MPTRVDIDHLKFHLSFFEADRVDFTDSLRVIANVVDVAPVDNENIITYVERVLAGRLRGAADTERTDIEKAQEWIDVSSGTLLDRILFAMDAQETIEDKIING